MNPTPAFLESEYPPASDVDAAFHVIPAGLERTVSYGGGTATAPAAILEASQQLEVFDGVSCPGERGIYTAPAPDLSGDTDAILDRIGLQISHAFDCQALPVLLGGEHTVSLAAFRALRKRNEPVGIIQFDAHADLRTSYQGSPLSHACVMSHALAMQFPILQIGVRSLSPAEVALRTSHPTTLLHVDARDLHLRGTTACTLPESFPEKLYITFDVDGLDPSLMPATGTPEPGGLFWHSALDAIEEVLRGRTLVGCDIVELAPIPGLHHPNLTAARLAYNLMGYASGSSSTSTSAFSRSSATKALRTAPRSA